MKFTISGPGCARVLNHWDGAGLKAAAAGPQPPGGHLAQRGRVQYEVLSIGNTRIISNQMMIQIHFLYFRTCFGKQAAAT